MSPVLRQLLVSCVLLSITLRLQQTAAWPSVGAIPDYRPEQLEPAALGDRTRQITPFIHRTLQLRIDTATVTSKVTLTTTQFQTCTAVTPGTPSCPTLPLAAVTKSAASPLETSPSDQDSSPIVSVPVLLPSCNCPGDDDSDQPKVLGNGYRLFTRRTPRLLAQQQPLIVLTRTTTLIDTVTETVQDAATTVALTYGGCVPTDAISTTACVEA